jgi:hypothetical protein
MMVARIHGRNTSDRTGAANWPIVPLSWLPAEFFSDRAAA